VGCETDYVFVVLKGPNRGKPLTANGLDDLLDGVRRRTGLAHATCHELRHTCLTQLREAGMALEAVQAQAGHASVESTRIYLHLADDWLASQYRRAAKVIDAQLFADQPGGARWAGRCCCLPGSSWSSTNHSWSRPCGVTCSRSRACCGRAASPVLTLRCARSPRSWLSVSRTCRRLPT